MFFSELFLKSVKIMSEKSLDGSFLNLYKIYWEKFRDLIFLFKSIFIF